MEQSRRSDVLLASSVASLARTGHWAEVDQLLKSLTKKNLSQQKSAAMAATIGSDVFFRIKQQADVSDAAKANLDRLGTALTAELESPTRLVKAIADLDSSSIDQRLSAARVLISGGDAAIAKLVGAAVSKRSTESRDEILKVAIRIRGGGEVAFRQLALYGTPEVRTRAIEALARIDARRFVVDFVTAHHAQDATKEEHEAAAAALLKISETLPGRDQAIEIVSRDLADARAIAAAVDNDDQTQTVWTVGDDRASVNHQSTQLMLAAFRDAADAGLRLRRLGTDSTELNAAMISASVAYRLAIDPDWGDAEQIEQVKELYGSVIDDSTLVAAISKATATGAADATATATIVGLLRLIDSEQFNVDPDLLIRSSGGVPTPLVALASSSDARVRYEAALVVSRLAGDTSYPGSSHVRQTLAEMTRLGDRPTAIVLETRAEFATHFERLLGELGWEPVVVRSVASLQRAIDRGGDLRLILSKIQISDLAPIEMIDVVRRLNRGNEVPIVFYDDDGISGRSDVDSADLGLSRWPAPVMMIDPPLSAAGLDGVIRDVDRRRRLPALTALDRQRLRTEATEISAP